MDKEDKKLIEAGEKPDPSKWVPKSNNYWENLTK